MPVSDAREDGDPLVVAFERVNIDDAAVAREWRHAGAANEILNTGGREHVGEFLLRHPQRLYGKEPVKQPLDVSVGGCDVVTIAGKRLQLAFLALEAAAERIADQGSRRRASYH